MSGNFLILGLPRSRTAWLANFMSHDGFFCMHEGMRGCTTVKEYTDKLLQQNVGDSTTGAVLFSLFGYFKNIKTLIIDSEAKHALEYYEMQYGTVTKQLETLVHKAKYELDAMPGVHVRAQDIFLKLPNIWDYLTDFAPFDGRRASMLIDMRVEIIEPYDYKEKEAMVLVQDFKRLQHVNT